MLSKATGTDTAEQVVEIKRLDPAVVNRTYNYRGLAKETNVLVTTGGAVSTATVSQLKSVGCKVTVLGTMGAAATTFTATPGCVVMDGSAMNPEDCAKAVAGKDVVIHAGMPTPDACTGALDQGTRNLLEAAATAGVKAFVYGSSARYGLFRCILVGVVGVGSTAEGSWMVSSLLRLCCCRECWRVARLFSGSQEGVRRSCRHGTPCRGLLLTSGSSALLCVSCMVLPLCCTSSSRERRLRFAVRNLRVAMYRFNVTSGSTFM